MGGMNVYDELIRAQLESLSADPTAGPIARVIWNSTEGRAKYDTGAAFRAFLANDGACVVGNHATANNNIRFHRGASAVLQFALGGDTTAEASLTVNLAQISAKIEGYATGSLPASAAGTEGRLLWDTTVHTLKADNGTAIVSLQPATTKGDVCTFSTVPTRLAVGTDGQVLISDSSAATGLAWSSSSPVDQSYEISNVTLAASISSNILTVALKTQDAGDPTAGDSTKIGFRNATATTGTYSRVITTSALSLELGTAVSLGLKTAVSSYFYIYALNNAGTVELFASAHPFWDEGVVQSTSTTGTSLSVLYGANARSNMAIRLIGRIKATWTNAVGWSAITNIDLLPFKKPSLIAQASGDAASASVGNPIIWPTINFDPYNAYNTGGGGFTAPVTGYYKVYGSVVTSNTAVQIYIYVATVLVLLVGTTDSNGECSFIGTVSATAGQVIDVRPGATLDVGSAVSNVTFELKE